MTLDEIGRETGTDKSSEYHDYLRVYERLLVGYGARMRLMEFGVLEGASMAMWRRWRPKAMLVGVDLDPQRNACDYLHLQADCRGALTELPRLVPFGTTFDAVIDDAGHQARAQVETLMLHWPLVSAGGVYIIEDTCCAFWPEFGGGAEWADRLGAGVFRMAHHGGGRSPGYMRRRDAMPYYRDFDIGVPSQDVSHVTMGNGFVAVHKAG